LIFEVTSTDVIHSFWVPDMYGKIDANPGRINRISFTARQEGTFRGVCAELCGAGHANMQFRVEAVSASAWQQWIDQQKKWCRRAATRPVVRAAMWPPART